MTGLCLAWAHTYQTMWLGFLPEQLRPEAFRLPKPKSFFFSMLPQSRHEFRDNGKFRSSFLSGQSSEDGSCAPQNGESVYMLKQSKNVAILHLQAIGKQPGNKTAHQDPMMSMMLDISQEPIAQRSGERTVTLPVQVVLKEMLTLSKLCKINLSPMGPSRMWKMPRDSYP